MIVCLFPRCLLADVSCFLFMSLPLILLSYFLWSRLSLFIIVFCRIFRLIVLLLFCCFLTVYLIFVCLCLIIVSFVLLLYLLSASDALFPSGTVCLLTCLFACLLAYLFACSHSNPFLATMTQRTGPHFRHCPPRQKMPQLHPCANMVYVR